MDVEILTFSVVMLLLSWAAFSAQILGTCQVVEFGLPRRRCTLMPSPESVMQSCTTRHRTARRCLRVSTAISSRPRPTYSGTILPRQRSCAWIRPGQAYYSPTIRRLSLDPSVISPVSVSDPLASIPTLGEKSLAALAPSGGRLEGASFLAG
jgi:hypothetical protein